MTKYVPTDILSTGNPNGSEYDASGNIPTTYPDCGPWQLATVFAGPGLCGEISFGASCLDSVTIKLTGNGAGGGADDYDVYFDGSLESSGTVVAGGSTTEVLNLTDSPCGTVITVGIYNGAFSDTVTLEITAVS